MTDIEKTKVGTRFQDALQAKDWTSAYKLLARNASWAFQGSDLVFSEIESADTIATIARTLDRSDANVALVCHMRQREIAAIDTYFSDLDGINVVCA